MRAWVRSATAVIAAFLAAGARGCSRRRAPGSGSRCRPPATTAVPAWWPRRRFGSAWARRGRSPVTAPAAACNNPHQDEGSDNGSTAGWPPASSPAFAADPGVVAAVGGLRRASATRTPRRPARPGCRDRARALVAATRARRNTFLPGASPPRLAAFAARARAGAFRAAAAAGPGRRSRRRCRALAGPPGPAVTRVGDGGAEGPRRPGPGARTRRRGAAARRRAARRLLWRAARSSRAASTWATCARLRGRGAKPVPAGTRPGRRAPAADAVLPRRSGPGRFARRFHAAAGFQPDEAATRDLRGGPDRARAGAPSRSAVAARCAAPLQHGRRAGGLRRRRVLARRGAGAEPP